MDSIFELEHLFELYELYEKTFGYRGSYVQDLNVNRLQDGEFYTLVPDLRQENGQRHLVYFRMSKGNFDHLITLIKPLMLHNNTHKSPIPVEERLALTLKILGSGCSMRHVATEYRLGYSTVHGIFIETCDALFVALKDHITAPKNDDWDEIRDDFFRHWQFPNCVGALDGKHVVVCAPANSGSAFRNYKKTFSIVLMALIDAKYRFLMFDVGQQGSKSDGGIFASSNMRTYLEQNLPKGEFELPGSNSSTPTVVVGDEAFGLKTYLMRPYSGRELDDEKRIFNYRLSRARRLVESTFGILVKRWRLFQRPIEFSVLTTIKAIKAAMALHNFLANVNGIENQENSDELFCVKTSFIGNDILFDRNVHYSNEAIEIRDNFKYYFIHEGAVNWQMNSIHH